MDSTWVLVSRKCFFSKAMLALSDHIMRNVKLVVVSLAVKRLQFSFQLD